MLLLTSFFVFQACKKSQTIAPSDLGYSYYPMEIGAWTIYEVDSTVWDDFTGLVTTYQYKVKELNESEFTDLEDRTATRIERYVKFSDTVSYRISDIWYSTRTSQRAERLEENKRFIKLVFPVRNGTDWDGNALNTDDRMEYEYKEVDKPYVVNGITFDSTLVVIQDQQFSLISQDTLYEVYARNVGMIYKRYQSLVTEIDGTIKSGVDYTYKYLESGK